MLQTQLVYGKRYAQVVEDVRIAHYGHVKHRVIDGDRLLDHRENRETRVKISLIITLCHIIPDDIFNLRFFSNKYVERLLLLWPCENLIINVVIIIHWSKRYPISETISRINYIQVGIGYLTSNNNDWTLLVNAPASALDKLWVSYYKRTLHTLM